MTTTLIYEPIAHISDDYFRWPKAGGSSSSRDDTGGQAPTKPEDLAQNTTDSNAIQLDLTQSEWVNVVWG
jgi:hypothetical protein